MKRVGLLGLGHAVPAHEAPVAGGIASDAERKMFTASGGRRWLGTDETLEMLMAEAARRALSQAGLDGSEVDRLYGYGLVSRYVSPNALFGAHRALGLSPSTWVVPVANDFASFLTAVALAREAVAAGTARHVLVVCGALLSRHMEAGSGYAVSIGDAAGAAVVGPAARDVIVDYDADTDSSLYDAAVVAAAGGEAPVFRLTPEQIGAVHDHGIERPSMLVRRLLERNGVSPDEVTLITHQPTRVLMEHWRRNIDPAAYLDTFDTLGNITLASVPATLAIRRREIATPWALLMSPGTGMHVVALLLRCGPRARRGVRTTNTAPPARRGR